MKIKIILSLILAVGLLAVPVSASIDDYHSSILPSPTGNTKITWNIVDAPEVAFSLFFSGTGAWLAEDGDQMSFTVTNVDTDVEGVVTLGNMTWVGNNSDISKDLALSVWGFTPWFPGLIVEVGTANLESLNETAHLSVARVSGNYMNGTMDSAYESINVNGVEYDCIVFDYIQDSPVFGEPQKTYLAYDTVTGVLVLGNTSFSFGSPYNLHISVASIETPIDLANLGITLGIVSLLVIFALVAIVRRSGR